jgi:hypothetical protein
MVPRNQLCRGPAPVEGDGLPREELSGEHCIHERELKCTVLVAVSSMARPGSRMPPDPHGSGSGFRVAPRVLERLPKGWGAARYEAPQVSAAQSFLAMQTGPIEAFGLAGQSPVSYRIVRIRSACDRALAKRQGGCSLLRADAFLT